MPRAVGNRGLFSEPKPPNFFFLIAMQVFYDIACKWAVYARKHGSEKLNGLLESGDMQVLLGNLHALMHDLPCQLTHAGFYCEKRHALQW